MQNTPGSISRSPSASPGRLEIADTNWVAIKVEVSPLPFNKFRRNWPNCPAVAPREWVSCSSRASHPRIIFPDLEDSVSLSISGQNNKMSEEYVLIPPYPPSSSLRIRLEILHLFVRFTKLPLRFFLFSFYFLHTFITHGTYITSHFIRMLLIAIVMKDCTEWMSAREDKIKFYKN